MRPVPVSHTKPKTLSKKKEYSVWWGDEGGKIGLRGKGALIYKHGVTNHSRKQKGLTIKREKLKSG